MKPAPDSWGVLWDPKYKGKVAISHVSEGKGLFLLLVAAYMGGGDEKLIDLGFGRFGSWSRTWGRGSRSPRSTSRTSSARTWLTPYWNGRAQLMVDQGLPLGTAIPKEGTPAITNSFGVPKGARNKALAYEFVNFYLDRAQQEAFARKIYYAPTNREVIPPEFAGRVAVGAEAIGRLRFPDEDHLAKARGAWVERWNKEVSTTLKYQK